MNRRLAVITAILLIGAALRLNGLNQMLGMVHYDEAYYSVDAVSLIEQPRLTPFFPDNYGRESLWMYLLAPSLAVFGAGSFGLRIVAIFTGVLTLAAAYRLTRELIGWRAGVWAMAGLAVLFWHVLASHEGLRALLFPLVGALAFAFLWNAQRTNRMRAWVVGGVLLGLLFYTYLAARVWLVLAAFTLVWWFVRGRRRGTVIAAMIALVIGLPLLIYLINNPAAADKRVAQVAISDVGTLLNNVVVWLRVPFFQGETDVMYNLSGRSLFDLPLGVLFISGLAGLIVVLKRDRAVWLILLAGASVAPGILTTDPLKWLRAIGLNIPIAVVLGVGGVVIEQIVRWVIQKGGLQSRPYKAMLIGMIPALCIVFAGADTYRDFNTWVSSPDLFIPMEQHIYGAIDWMADNTPENVPVYFSPFSLDHPVLRLREWRLGQRPVGAFDATNCVAVPNVPQADYFALTLYDPGFKDRLAQWADVQQVYDDPGRYGIFQATPHADLFSGTMQDFGDLIGARVLSQPATNVMPGKSLDVTFGLRALHPVAQAYTLFVHLYQGTTLGQNIQLVSQVDQPLCPSDPPSSWRPDEMVIQSYSLPIPADIAAGGYTVAYGIYDSASVTRLSVGSTNFAVIQTITAP